MEATGAIFILTAMDLYSDLFCVALYLRQYQVVDYTESFAFPTRMVTSVFYSFERSDAFRLNPQMILIVPSIFSLSSLGGDPHYARITPPLLCL